MVTLELVERRRSCRNRVSSVFGANVSFKNEMRAGEAASVWIFLRFRWYCRDMLAPCLADEWLGPSGVGRN
jgi:hypothetical protein